MRVFRVEGPDGVGPYRAWSRKQKFYRRHFERYNGPKAFRYPTPYDDRSMWSLDDLFSGATQGHVFGFKDLDQLIGWFRPGLKDLRRDGQSVVEYDVPRRLVRFGRRQISFPKDRARLVGAVPWEQVYKLAR